MSQLDTLCENLNVKITSRYIGRGSEEWQASHWKCTLRFQGRRLTVDFYMGAALSGEPSAADVIHSLCLDARAGEQGFHNFCDDFGYDSDSRRAEKIYKACEKMAPKVRRLLGDHFDDFCNSEH